MKDTFFSDNARLPADDVIRSLEGGLPGLDASRAQGYARLATLRDAKAGSLNREQRLLAIKSGDRHPRIAQAADAFAANERLRREVAVAREVVETKVPEANDSTFVLYGFVRRRSTQAGIPGLTVALTDSDGLWVRKLGYACTDARGYFELTVKAEARTQQAAPPPEKTEELSDAEKKKLEEEKARAAAATAAAGGVFPSSTSTDATFPPDATRLTLTVFNRSGRALHRETKPVNVRAGALDYRVILLGDSDEDCGCNPPPAQPGGRPSSSGPVVKATAPAPAAVPPAPAAEASVAHVADLKDFQPPAPPSTAPGGEAGQPLEAIRGIGPKKAEQLRKAGIADVAAFEKTPGEKLVRLAGFDKKQPKDTTSREKKAAAGEADAVAKPVVKRATTKAATTKAKTPKK